MSSQTAWKLVAEASHLPVFVRSSVTRSGYEVFVTDLCRVWGEKLSRRDIIKRALNEGCSIDPTEGDDQYDILLQKLNAALTQDVNTTMVLCQGDTDSDISLHLSAPLPTPLPALRWVCNMSRLPEHAVTDLLIKPLLHKVNHLNAQMQRLVDDIRTKDSVIFKIIDRLETSGQDLSLVFPNVSNLRVSKKKSQKEQYAPHVKGLAEFDSETWRKQAIEVESDENPSAEMFSAVLGDLQTKGAAMTQTTAVGDQWWHNLSLQPEATQRIPDSMPTRDNEHPESTAPYKNGNVATAIIPETNDFERQSTPPDLKRKVSPSNASDMNRTKPPTRGQSDLEQANVGEDDETASEEEEDNADDFRARYTTASAPSKDFSRGQEQSSPSTTAIQSDKLPDRTGKEAEVSCDEPSIQDSNALSPQPMSTSASAKSVNESRPSPAPVSSRPRGKLGGMGGKPKSPPQVEKAAEEEAAEPAPPVKAKAKLGGIGGKAKNAADTKSKPQTGDAAASNLDEPRDEVSRPAKPAGTGVRQQPTDTPANEERPNASGQAQDGRTRDGSSQASPQETPEELADRKRNELKRQIEAKAKAPAKKKRKF